MDLLEIEVVEIDSWAFGHGKGPCGLTESKIIEAFYKLDNREKNNVVFYLSHHQKIIADRAATILGFPDNIFNYSYSAIKDDGKKYVEAVTRTKIVKIYILG